MAIAVAGPLCRCYGGDAAATARAQPGVRAWQAELLQALAGRPKGPAPWVEDADGEVLRVDLGPAGWMALRLFAFYSERTDLEMPDTVPALLELDPEWRAASDGRFAQSRFGHLLAARLWLPGDFPFTARVPFPDGEQGEFGSVTVLQDQLGFLDARTFQAEAAEFAGWLDLPAPPGGDLLVAARRGFAGLRAAVGFAASRSLPLLVQEA
jgi:hypothetical protein